MEYLNSILNLCILNMSNKQHILRDYGRNSRIAYNNRCTKPTGAQISKTVEAV